MATSGGDIYNEVDAELNSLGINTAPEVADFRIPGDRDGITTNPTGGDMKTVIDAVSATLKNRFVSRKRVRSSALRLLNEGKL